MIINCDNCNKKFEIDQNLIPAEGRTLQCGSCNYQWFFKLKKINETSPKEIIIDEKDQVKPTEKEIIKKTNDDKFIKDNNSATKKQNINNINYFKFIIVGIISITALILLLETFKLYLSTIFPNIEILLDNLYQSLEDIKLFILDLIK